MKRIVLLRHGIPEQPTNDKSDHSRELLDEGAEQARLVGDQILTEDYTIDLIVTSSARRACETAYALAEKLNYSKSNIVIQDSLYNATVSEILDVITEIDDKYNTVVLVGHNPGFSDCSCFVSGEKNISLSTCNYCIIELSGNWNEIKENSGKLISKNCC
ncbi:MAG: histidine phosphatase family protein [Legionellales bacterium]|nr:histidine phosphatase family protein [Legionellales bacterium]